MNNGDMLMSDKLSARTPAIETEGFRKLRQNMFIAIYINCRRTSARVNGLKN